MKPIHLCVPVLNRYDLLRNMLVSLEKSTVRPARVYIIDNGRSASSLALATGGLDECVVHTPEVPMGLAEAWNWFVRNVPEERLIVNDDLLFEAGSLQRLGEMEGDFVSALPGSNAFSCFLLRDTCVEKIGLFDEAISPGYAYYEDCDYVNRMILKGVPITGVLCGVEHVGSQTTAKYSPQEWLRHHDRFLFAQSNFVRKWGRMPNEALAKAEYDRGQQS